LSFQAMQIMQQQIWPRPSRHRNVGNIRSISPPRLLRPARLCTPLVTGVAVLMPHAPTPTRHCFLLSAGCWPCW
jgi:hypothetical protein